LIHPTAIVSSQARLGASVSIGAYSIVHDNVELGDGCQIGAFCEIGHASVRTGGKPLVIGPGALVRSHSVFYEGSTFGERLVTGHRVTVREGTNAGVNLQIGSLGDIQGTCQIGDYVRFHSNVHIGQHSTVGNFVWIFPYVVLTNDPHPPSEILRGVTLEDYVAVATMSIVLPGVRVGRGALVGAHSSVSRDVDPDTVVAGAPAKAVCKTTDIKLRDGSGRPAYPWRRQFHRGYPDAVVERWLVEFGLGK
jgi:acetyltransferase-like isoleucine patch superfamily enzyme